MFLFIIGICHSQETLFSPLDSLTDRRDLSSLNSALSIIDTTELSTIQKAQYNYYLGSLLYFEDNNKEATEALLLSKKLIPNTSENDSFRFKVNDRLLECIGSTTEYSIRPAQLIEENCRIANEKQEALLLYNCYYYQYVEALDRKENANALMLMREAISILDANKEPNLIANLQSNIGHVMLNLGELDSVLPYFDKAKAYYTKVKDTTKIAYIYNNYGNYYKTKGEYDIALEYLKSADSFPLNQEIASTKKTILKNIADTYYFKNEFEQAALSYEIWAKLSDSLDRASHTEKIQYYNTKYQTSEKERELLIEQQMKKQNRNIAIGLGGGLAAVSIFAFLVYKNTRRKQRIAEQEKELEIQKKEKILKEQELNAIDAMIAGQEKERQRLADDLHDSVGATLSAAKLQFDHIAKNRDKADTLDELFEKTGSLLEDAYTEVRSMAHLKNSGVIASKGLLPAVKKLAKNASISDGLTIEVEDFGLNEKLEGSLEISIFRIIQELVTNIIKHAQASEAQISITQHEDVLNIIVEDNGKGFNPRKKIKEDGMGLHSIEKRVEHLEGSLEVDAAPGRGTNILIDIPL